VQSSKLHEVFNAWSKAPSLNEWKGRSFSDAMTERGFKKDKSSVMYFLDIKLVKSVNDFLDHEGKPLMQGKARPESDGGGGKRGDDDLEF
jgi:putative DNA primase/helicase